MHRFSRFLCVALAVSVLSISGCEKGKDDKSDIKKSESSVAESKMESLSEVSNIGKYLSNMAEKLSNGYTMHCTVTTSNSDKVIKLTRAVNGESVYQLQEESVGGYGIISVDGNTYNFDNAAGMYQKTDADARLSIIEEVINRNLPMSDECDYDSCEDVQIEQYVFAGESYITNISFVFDKKSGDLQKYSLRYSVEGHDDVIETRTIDKLQYEADEQYFDTAFLENMTDFGSLNDEDRQTFCKKVCTGRGITDTDLTQFNLCQEDFKDIEFSAFLNLIYTL